MFRAIAARGRSVIRKLFRSQRAKRPNRRRHSAPFRSEWCSLEQRCLLAAPSNLALTLAADSVLEGGSASLSGSFADADPGDSYLLVINWGDASTNQTVGPFGPGVSSFGPINHIYLDDSSSDSASANLTISATLIDSGLESAAGTATITVNNAAPLTNVALVSAVNEDGVATLVGDIVDPGSRDAFTLVVSWGDGSEPETFSYPAGTTLFRETHRYLDDDPTGSPSDRYTISLALSDDDNGSTTGSVIASVNNVAPVLSGVTTTSPINEGSLSTLSGMIVDPGTRDSFSLDVDWGDGSAVQTFRYSAGTNSFSETHRYKNDGTFAVSLKLRDDDGGSTEAGAIVAVNNVPPTLRSVALPSVMEGRLAALSGQISDPGVLDRLTLVVNWGDGSAPETTSFPAVNGVFTARHRYWDEGSYPVSVSVRDDATAGAAATTGMTAIITNGDIIAVGNDAGAAPEVRVLDANTGGERFRFMAYASNFRGGVRVAVGDVNGDGIYDVVTGAGRGGKGEVRVFDGTNGTPMAGPLGRLFPYDSRLRGGVFVAAGDVNGDDFDDVITAPGAGTAPVVRIYSGADGSELQNFLAFDAQFRQGLSVAAGDMNGDGKADLVVGAGAGAIPQVRVFDGRTFRPFSGAIGSFLVYDMPFRGGVFVAAGDVNGDGRADILAAPGRGIAAHVRAFDVLTSAELSSFVAYPSAFRGGAGVAVGDVNGDGRPDIISAPGPGKESRLRAFDALTSSELNSLLAFEAPTRRGMFVAISRRR